MCQCFVTIPEFLTPLNKRQRIFWVAGLCRTFLWEPGYTGDQQFLLFLEVTPSKGRGRPKANRQIIPCQISLRTMKKINRVSWWRIRVCGVKRAGNLSGLIRGDFQEEETLEQRSNWWEESGHGKIWWKGAPGKRNSMEEGPEKEESLVSISILQRNKINRIEIHTHKIHTLQEIGSHNYEGWEVPRCAISKLETEESQILIWSRNTLPDTNRIIFDRMSGCAVAQSGGPTKLTSHPVSLEYSELGERGVRWDCRGTLGSDHSGLRERWHRMGEKKS